MCFLTEPATDDVSFLTEPATDDVCFLTEPATDDARTAVLFRFHRRREVQCFAR